MEYETVVIIQKHNTDSHSGRSSFAAVAKDVLSAKQWIQDEVDHKHDNGNRYVQGKDADWWIQYGTFSLNTVVVH